ncbi:MAG: peptidase S41, partial [Gammaproteobacteria bacterium]|nr:peptidase S41 [Gammaproteobacteria bacterium]
AVRAAYEPRILAAKTDDEYWELLDKMTGELKDSHTRVHSPKLVQQQRIMSHIV